MVDNSQNRLGNLRVLLYEIFSWGRGMSPDPLVEGGTPLLPPNAKFCTERLPDHHVIVDMSGIASQLQIASPASFVYLQQIHLHI